MKTLLVSEVFPPQSGGSGRWFWEIYRRLDASQTRIIAGAQTGDQAFDQTHQLDLSRIPMSFPSWGIASWSGLTNYRKLTKRIANVAQSQDTEQIHCGKVLPEGFAASRAAKRLRIPYLCYVHGEELNIAAGSRELRWMTRATLSSASRIIANSQNTAQLLRDDWNLSEHQLRVLHPGVDLERFRPADRDLGVRKRLGWGDRPVILTVGRLQQRKGQDQLIRAMPSLVKRHPNLLYSIIGDGPERKRLGQLARDVRVVDSIEFREEVDDAEMVNCYQQCNVFALPNRTVDGDFEGFGMVLLEAQACGKPVITGTSGGTGEAMQHGKTGIRVDCNSVDTLAEAIDRILADADLQRVLGTTGHQWATANFGWSSLVEQASTAFQFTE